MASKKKRDSDSGVGVDSLDRQKVEPPRKFKVVLYNDDYTPMDFVVTLLMQHFHKPKEDAVALTLKIHNGDRGIAGVYSREIAETKAHTVNSIARQHQHPFRAEAEPE
jgi:ATP-dependent Clp protease adaptor protein ClpS